MFLEPRISGSLSELCDASVVEKINYSRNRATSIRKIWWKIIKLCARLYWREDKNCYKSDGKKLKIVLDIFLRKIYNEVAHKNKKGFNSFAKFLSYFPSINERLEPTFDITVENGRLYVIIDVENLIRWYVSNEAPDGWIFDAKIFQSWAEVYLRKKIDKNIKDYEGRDKRLYADFQHNDLMDQDHKNNLGRMSKLFKSMSDNYKLKSDQIVKSGGSWYSESIWFVEHKSLPKSTFITDEDK